MPPGGGQGPRKIASIGVHVSRWVTTHGYALNVDLDPAPFTEWITACGLEDAAFTTMARELGSPAHRRGGSARGDRRGRRGLRARLRGAPGRRRRGALAAADPRLARRAMSLDIRRFASRHATRSLHVGAGPPRRCGRQGHRRDRVLMLRQADSATLYARSGAPRSVRRACALPCRRGSSCTARRERDRSSSASRATASPRSQARPSTLREGQQVRWPKGDRPRALDGRLDHDDAHGRAPPTAHVRELVGTGNRLRLLEVRVRLAGARSSPPRRPAPWRSAPRSPGRRDRGRALRARRRGPRTAPSPAPTKMCSVHGGQCTKSHAFSARSWPSTISRHSPERTRKSSCASSPWYMPLGSPGRRIPTLMPSSPNRAFSPSNGA